MHRYGVATLLGRLIPVLVLPALLACSPGDARSPADRAAARHGVADLVFFNGRIITLDPRMPEVRALAVREGRVIALGEEADIEPLTDAATRLEDLQGKTLMPGLLDARDPDADRAPPPCIETETDPVSAPAAQAQALALAPPAAPDVDVQPRGSEGVVGLRLPRVAVDALPALLARERQHASVLHLRIGHWPACGARERLLLQQVMRELAATKAGARLRIELDPEPAAVHSPDPPVADPASLAAERPETPGIYTAAVPGEPVQPRAALRVTPSPWQTIADAVKGGADAQKALRSFTVDAAREMGLQHEVGVLAAGKSADLVVLDRDPLQESPPRIAGTQVLQTWIGGVRVFARAEPVQP